jgi:hypothetical protein
MQDLICLVVYIEKFPLVTIIEMSFSSSDIRWVKGDELREMMPAPEMEFDICDIPNLLADDQNRSFRDVWFRCEKLFVAGNACHPLVRSNWEVVLASHPDRIRLLRWLDGVKVQEFTSHFKGSFKNEEFDCDSPVLPFRARNASVCSGYDDFIMESIASGVNSGAMKVWGKVGEVVPPICVSPITIEPLKPRFCHDMRYFNCWMSFPKFSLPSVLNVPPLGAALLSTFDLKAAYYNWKLCEDDLGYFGFEWDGVFYVYTVLPFGWSPSAYILQQFMEAIMCFISSFGIPGVVYLDDVLLAQCFPMMQRGMVIAAEWSGFIFSVVLNALGIFVSLKKSSPIPEKAKVFLGFLVDCVDRTFVIPSGKVEKFVNQAEVLLSSDMIAVKSLERIVGKCVHFGLVIKCGMFFLRRFYAVLKESKCRTMVKFKDFLKDDLMEWRDMVVSCPVTNWSDPRHVSLSCHTDASSLAWFGVVISSALPLKHSEFGSNFALDLAWEPIHVKETVAVCETFSLLAPELADLRVDFWCDNKAVVDSYRAGGCRVQRMNECFRSMAMTARDCNIMLRLHWISTKENLADGGSRLPPMHDCTLQARRVSWLRMRFTELSVDGLATSANALFPTFYSLFQCKGSAGVNLLAQNPDQLMGRGLYLFPPEPLVVAIVDWLCCFPALHGVLLLWASDLSVFPRMKSRALVVELLARQKDCSWIRMNRVRHKKHGVFPVGCPFDLWLFVF